MTSRTKHSSWLCVPLPPDAALEELLSNYEEAAIEYGEMEALGPHCRQDDLEKACATLEKARRALRETLGLPPN